MKRTLTRATVGLSLLFVSVACETLPDDGETGEPTASPVATTSPQPTGTPQPIAVSFQDDIVPMFYASCGAGLTGCHDAAPYNAAVNFECRGWLSLADEPLGSLIPGGPNAGNPTGCPDFTLYERITDIASWTCNTPEGAGQTFIVPSDPTASYLLQRMTLDPTGPCPLPDDPMPMPPVGTVAQADIDLLVQWIREGAQNN